MNALNELRAYWGAHGTKILAALQGLLAVTMAMDRATLVLALGERGIAWVALALAGLTFLRGFGNEALLKERLATALQQKLMGNRDEK